MPLAIFCFFFYKVQLIYNVVLISGIQQSDSFIYMCVYINIYIHMHAKLL